MKGPLYDHHIDAPSLLKGANNGSPNTKGNGEKTVAKGIWNLFCTVLSWYIFFILSTCFVALIPIAGFAPRLLSSRFLDMRAGPIMFVHSAFFLLIFPLTSRELAPLISSPPYLGVLFLGAGIPVAKRYLNGVLARLLSIKDDKNPALTFTRTMVATGFSGGTIPRSLRVIVVYGLIGGTICTIGVSLNFTQMLASPWGRDGSQVVLFGDGIVRGEVELFEVAGACRFGREGDEVGCYSNGGLNHRPGGERGWVHITHRGLVTGKFLKAEMRGRGILFEGRAALRAWMLAKVGYILGGVLLIVACLIAAQGLPLGFLLLLSWATLTLLHGVGTLVLVPDSREQGELLLYLFPITVIAILYQPDVRSYLTRPYRKASGVPS